MGRLDVRVQPGARRSGFVGWYGDLPKLAVTAPPVDGAANEEVLRTVATAFGLRPRQVRLVGGGTSRTKRLEIDGLTEDEIATVLAACHRR